MKNDIINFIDESEIVYICDREINNEEDFYNSNNEKVIGYNKFGLITNPHMYEYDLVKYEDINNMWLVSLIDCYSSRLGGDDYKKIIKQAAICNTLILTDKDIELY